MLVWRRAIYGLANKALEGRNSKDALSKAGGGVIPRDQTAFCTPPKTQQLLVLSSRGSGEMGS